MANGVLKQHLQTALRPRLECDLPVIDPTKYVCNSILDCIPSPLIELPYQLPLGRCQCFSKAPSECHLLRGAHLSHGDSYAPLQAIFAHLKNQLYQSTDDLPLNSSTFCLRDMEVRENYVELLKPDLFCSMYSPSRGQTQICRYTNLSEYLTQCESD